MSAVVKTTLAVNTAAGCRCHELVQGIMSAPPDASVIRMVDEISDSVSCRASPGQPGGRLVGWSGLMAACSLAPRSPADTKVANVSASTVALASQQHVHAAWNCPGATSLATLWLVRPCFVPLSAMQICQVYDSAECVRNIHPDQSWRQAATAACQVGPTAAAAAIT